MVKSKRNNISKKFRYFFINKELHKILRVNRIDDIIVAWSYPQGKRVAYSYADISKNMQHAFSTKEVAKMFDRNQDSIYRYIREGAIKKPQQTYSIGSPEKIGTIYFSEDDLREFHSYLYNVNLGRPRKDGEINHTKLMTRSELDAMINRQTILYVKNTDGEFMPVWKQPEW